MTAVLISGDLGRVRPTGRTVGRDVVFDSALQFPDSSHELQGSNLMSRDLVARGGFGRQAERAAKMAALGRQALQEHMPAVRTSDQNGVQSPRRMAGDCQKPE